MTVEMRTDRKTSVFHLLSAIETILRCSLSCREEAREEREEGEEESCHQEDSSARILSLLFIVPIRWIALAPTFLLQSNHLSVQIHPVRLFLANCSSLRPLARSSLPRTLLPSSATPLQPPAARSFLLLSVRSLTLQYASSTACPLPVLSLQACMLC